ncbi:MAG TPA: carboxypeptidase regulatory-like domain-containing protein, partial [Pyrinomonadaceae bacterium]|nr:carboxypeptidase regulatory-like domain-containing protein [Pyrinomonadaceae bacterium]
PLPGTVVLTTTILDPAGPVDQLEEFEGMRLTAASVLSVAPTNDFGEIYTVLSGVARPFREPGIDITLPVPPDPTSGVPDCCIPRWDRNPERIMIDTDGLAGSSVLNVTSNTTLTNIVGPLDFTFGDYKIVPETPPTVASVPMAAVPVPDPVPLEFTVSGKNIENFANDATQRQKAALAIRTVEKLPDVIGVIEIVDLASLQALATQVNNDTVAAGGADPAYQAYLIPAPGGGTQHLGFLVKASRVQVDSVTQERAAETFVNPVNGSTETLHDRPPLVLQATLNPPTTLVPRRVIVVVNHMRSFIDVELVTGEGTRVREKRKRQGESVAGLLQELQTLNPGVPVIAVGDYNAYQFSDGYTDPIATIKGMPTADDQIVVDQSPDVVNPNFINLTDSLPESERYSFIFEGTPQALDHIIVNSAASAILQRYAIARNNADFPDSAPFTDVARPEVHSDHDSPIAYFSFPIPTAADASITGRVVSASGRGIANVVVTVTDMNGNRVGSATTNPFGFYAVSDLPVGNSYVVTLISRRFIFEPSSQVVTLDNDLDGLNFSANR